MKKAELQESIVPIATEQSGAAGRGDFDQLPPRGKYSMGQREAEARVHARAEGQPEVRGVK